MSSPGNRNPFILLTLGAIVACSQSPTQAGGSLGIVADPEVLTLTVGERETISGTTRTVTFMSVSDDWRCPTDAVCISEGSFGVSLGIGNPATMPPMGAPDLHVELFGHEAKRIDGMSFEVVSLTPEPTLVERPAPESYVLTLRIAPAP